MNTTKTKRFETTFAALILLGAVHGFAAKVVAQNEGTTIPAAPTVSRVLHTVPADAVAFVFTHDLDAVLDQPILDVFAKQVGTSFDVLKSANEIVDGAAVFAFSGTLLNPFSWRVTLAAETIMPREVVFDRLENKFVPTWNQSPLGTAVGKAQFWKDGDFARVVIVGKLMLSVGFGVKDGMIYASSGAGAVESWQNGYAGASFVKEEEFMRLTDGWVETIGGMSFVDLRPVIAMAGATMNSSIPHSFEAVGLGQLRSVALLTAPQLNETSTPSKSARGDEVGKRPLAERNPKSAASEVAPPFPSARIAVGVDDFGLGVWRWVAPSATSMSLAGSFPSDTLAFVNWGMSSAADMFQTAMLTLAKIDPAIALEYAQEREDFRKEVGFDPHAELLANFTTEFAWGWVPTEDDATFLLAIRLRDASAFDAQLRDLARAFRLEMSSSIHRGVAVHRAQRKMGTFSFAEVKGTLLISPTYSVVERAIDAALTGKSLAASESYTAVNAETALPASARFFVDTLELAPELATLFDTDSKEPASKKSLPLGGQLTRRDGVLALDMTWPNDRIGLFSTALTSIMASVQQARMQSIRTCCESNVKGILITCFIYANEHKNEWPPNLEGFIADGALLPEMLSGPCVGVSGNDFASGSMNPNDKSIYFLYRRPVNIPNDANRGKLAVVCEPRIHEGGIVVGFLDGHVEWVESPRAEEIIRYVSGK